MERIFDIKVSDKIETKFREIAGEIAPDPLNICLLYTSDAADEGLGVDLGGRRIIKKKIKEGSVEVVGVFVF